MPTLPIRPLLRELYVHGVGIREIADAAGMDPTHVSRIIRGERGEAGLTPETADRLALGLTRLATIYRENAERCREAAKALRKEGRKR